MNQARIIHGIIHGSIDPLDAEPLGEDVDANLTAEELKLDENDVLNEVRNVVHLIPDEAKS